MLKVIQDVFRVISWAIRVIYRVIEVGIRVTFPTFRVIRRCSTFIIYILSHLGAFRLSFSGLPNPSR